LINRPFTSPTGKWFRRTAVRRQRGRKSTFFAARSGYADAEKTSSAAAPAIPNRPWRLPTRRRPNLAGGAPDGNF
jgi:hypothetical protein